MADKNVYFTLTQKKQHFSSKSQRLQNYCKFHIFLQVKEEVWLPFGLFKWFARNKMIWSFCHFLAFEEKSIF